MSHYLDAYEDYWSGENDYRSKRKHITIKNQTELVGLPQKNNETIVDKSSLDRETLKGLADFINNYLENN